MIFLQHVADYMRTGKAIEALRKLLRRHQPIINFNIERDNRPPRYIEVVKAYRNGDRIDDIATRFGCSRGTVHRYARMAGLFRPKESSVRDGIIAMYQLQKPIAEIATKFGVSPSLVSKYASEAKINRNPHRKVK